MYKQKLLTVFILLFAFTYAKGQDIIITTQKDTIFCKIISITPTQIRCEQKYENQYTLGRIFPIEQVLEYYRDAILDETSHSIISRKLLIVPFQQWRIGIQGGESHLPASFAGSKRNMQRLGTPESQINEYHKQLRNGMHIGADVHYFLTPSWGVGLKYSFFTNLTRANLSVKDFFLSTSLIDTSMHIPTYKSSGVNEKSYVNYIGPSVIFQHWLDKNHKFQMSEALSLGYAYYRKEDRLNPYNYPFYSLFGFYQYNMLEEGNTGGGNFQVAINYYLLSWLSIGANIEYFAAIFSKTKVSSKDSSMYNYLNKADYLNMSRLDYSIGVFLHF